MREGTERRRSQRKRERVATDGSDVMPLFLTIDTKPCDTNKDLIKVEFPIVDVIISF